ncbi:MAG: hypothetical protein RJB62_1752 [Pseudomonadota bacterium]
MPKTSFHKRAAQYASLLGTASFLTMIGGGGANAQVNEILVTGSLITGAPSVGVPVTDLDEQDFRDTGALTITEMLADVPSVFAMETVSVARGGGGISYAKDVKIHDFSPGSGVETLLLIDGSRWPVQGHGSDSVDPSIIPNLAVERVDVLTAGASAVYGSDATAGVINVILKRNFEGAVTEGTIGMSTGAGGRFARFGQLYGTTWDTGGVTVSYEFYEQQSVSGAARDYFTGNYEAYGYDDKTWLGHSNPGVVSIGGASTDPTLELLGFLAENGRRACENCYDIPIGTGWDYGAAPEGPTVDWSDIMAGAWTVGADNGQNRRNPWHYGTLLPRQQRNAATITFDQDLFEGISFFGTAFYSNRRAEMLQAAMPSGNASETYSRGGGGYRIPTHNPYYPTNVPNGTDLRVHYLLQPEFRTRNVGGEVAARWSVGFNFSELPFDWAGKVFYSKTDDHNYAYGQNMLNRNAVNAALGNTISASGTGAAYTKPDNVPYLNVFCDATQYQCNSPVTFEYMRAFRDQDSNWLISEWGANFDGPIFDLPGGTIMGAIGAQKLSHNFSYVDETNRNTHSPGVIVRNTQFEEQNVWALFGQLNLPLVGGDFSAPLFEFVDVELGYRYDNYDVYGGVNTPKVAVNWGMGYGFVARGAWGKSFRAPSFAEGSTFAGTRIVPLNPGAGGSAEDAPLDCDGNGSPTPGSVTAILNPTCNPLLEGLGGIQVTGGAGAAVPIRGSGALGPQTVKQWVLGFNWQPPDGFLSGLNVDVAVFNLDVDNIISPHTIGEGVNDPLSTERYIVIPNPAENAFHPSNAAFLELIQNLQATGAATFDPSVVGDIKFIEDGANRNIGKVNMRGIDFNARYDWDMGDLGAWHVGATGYYELDYWEQAAATTPKDNRYEGKNSGHQLKNVRGRIGWTDGAWSATGFVNYHGHKLPFDDIMANAPRCYWDTGFSAGSCYAGSPYNRAPTGEFENMVPSMYLFDLSVGYNTGMTPTNDYLDNIQLQLVVNNILDRQSPFTYHDRGGDYTAFDMYYGELQRVVSFTVTKTW